jgi:hypothetical protein
MTDNIVSGLNTLPHVAAGAHCIVLAFGVLKGDMRHYAQAVVRSLEGRELLCLGTTVDGSPRHPLYLAGDSPLQRWNGWPT